MAFRRLAQSLRAIGERLIPGLLRSGQSVRETVETLREAGIDYGESVMTQDVVSTQADLERSRISQPFDPNLPVPEPFFRDRNYRSVWEYQYTFRYTYQIPGEIVEATDYFSITSRERLSLNALAEDIDKAIEKRENYIGTNVSDVSLFEGVHNVRKSARRS